MDALALRLRADTEFRRKRESQSLALKTPLGTVGTGTVGADMVGTSYTHLWKAENGKASVGLDLLGKLAEALDVPIADLVAKATHGPSQMNASHTDSAQAIQIEYADVRRKS